jgi:hypothetical protein
VAQVWIELICACAMCHHSPDSACCKSALRQLHTKIEVHANHPYLGWMVPGSFHPFIHVKCYKVLQRDAKEIRRKGEETKQETERHTHGTEPTSQPRPTQNTMEAAKATQEHEPTGTKKRNNHTRHKPENARPQRPPAQTPNRNRQQRHKTA